jgi:hypothetical protein
MSESGPSGQAKYGHWLAGAFAVAIIALGMYLNFGGSFNHKAEAAVGTPAETAK